MSTDTKIKLQKISLEDVQNAVRVAINSERLLEIKSQELHELTATNQKNITTASLMVYDFCSANGRGSQAKIVDKDISKSAVSRYFATGQVIAKLGAKKLVKSNVTANDINNSLSAGHVTSAKLEAVKNVSELKAVLTPKHPANRQNKGKNKGKTAPKTPNYSSVESWGNFGAELALNGKMSRVQFETIAKQIVANFALHDQNKQTK